MVKKMKIHIIGASGSGKTYLASRLAEKNNIPCFDLDSIFWDNSASYGAKRSVDERNKLLGEILDNENWIIEGVYYDWLDQSFKAADVIYVLDIKTKICKRRIVKRFLRRKLKLEPGKKETVKSLIALLKWTDEYRNNNLVKIKKRLQSFPDKTIYLRSVKEVNEIIK